VGIIAGEFRENDGYLDHLGPSSGHRQFSNSFRRISIEFKALGISFEKVVNRFRASSYSLQLHVRC
jgi:hypothetical protein